MGWPSGYTFFVSWFAFYVKGCFMFFFFLLLVGGKNESSEISWVSFSLSTRIFLVHIVWFLCCAEQGF